MPNKDLSTVVNFSNPVKLREFILEKQGKFTISSLEAETRLSKRIISRMVVQLAKEGLVIRELGWKYSVVPYDTSWKIL